MLDSQGTPGRRERKKHDTYRAIAAAAVRLVSERGLDGVTVDDISAVADVSPRTFFNYFGSKEDAVMLPYPDSEEQEKRARIAIRDAPAELSTLAAVHLAVRKDITRFLDDREEWLMRLKVIEDNPSLIQRMISTRGSSEQLMVETVAARAGADPADLFPRLLTSAVMATVGCALRQWSATGGGDDLPELVDATFAALADGLPDPKTG
ncbi:TetR/AcrR family transcriptional regulator [Amycolatopsis minnesotensis]|uniref:TetR/AcrR family transcriptional regulator n=1 Tax=Amycolatopsis minnesotensis TaxID=337894 RepID=A0ABN2RPY7_9PSEU